MKESFAQRLKGLRNEKNYSQREMAALLNIVQVSYLRWEQGKTEPNINNICRLCEIFNVSSDYLLGLEDDTAFSFSSDAPSITADEKLLLNTYRELPSGKKKAIFNLLDIK